ncbi:hypothetical protein [Bhargavaea ginsengi]|uniref:hypothetical protein n=1 Tax=Bhargavaea ginsengi TaxID=426757 RepID=UPI003C761996
MDEKERRAIETVAGMKVEELRPDDIEYIKGTFGYSRQLLLIEWREFKKVVLETLTRRKG